MDEVKLLAFLGPGNVGRNEGVHESLKVGTPPLRQCVSNYPFVVDALSCELCSDRCKALVQPRLETLDLVIFSAEVIARTVAFVGIFSIRMILQKILTA